MTGLLLAYACSGFAGLVHEVTWARLLTLYVGHTTAAVSTVTAVFMGGLGLGALVGGRAATRLHRHQALRAYALLEAGVAVAALAIVFGLGLVTPLLSWAYGEDGSGPLFAFVRFICCAAVLLPPAAALGATFPLAAKASAHASGWRQHAASWLYGVNTAGAAFGAWLSGFVLLPAFGVVGTTLVGVGTGIVSTGIALALARRAAHEVERTNTATEPTRDGPVRDRAHDGQTSHLGLAGFVLTLTGLATFISEIAWTRVLAMILGPSTYGFAAMLSSFIIGIALGSVGGALLASRVRRAALPLALALVATAIGACIGIARVDSVGIDWAAGAAGATGFPIVDLAVSQMPLAFSLTLPTAIGLGVAFPLSLRLACGSGPTSPQRLGVLYALNTTASVVGALAAGFVAIPAIGLHSTLLAAAGMLLVAAVAVLAVGITSRAAQAVALASVGAAIALVVASPAWDNERLASGGYLYSRFVPAGTDREASLTAGTLLYYREGAAGTVSVKALTGERSLAIDGKVDASTARDMLTQKALAHLPLLLHPAPKHVAIVGLGSGVTAGAALTHSVESVDVVELSPEVVTASRFFDDESHQPLGDPRTRLIAGDGRSHLSLTARRYDVVVSEPSNPWMAGVAALFTREFFTAVRDRLQPGGLFCQWAHTYDISETDLQSIVATFRAVFPNGTMWLVGDGDLLLIGSNAPLDSHLEAFASAWARPGVAADLRDVGVRDPFSLFSLYVGGPDEMERYARDAPVQADSRTALEFSGPYAVFGAPETNHAPALRALLDGGRRPTGLARALEDATATQWRDRGAMLMRAQAFEAAYRDYDRAIDLAPTDVGALDGFVRAAGATQRAADAEARLRTVVARHATEAAPRVALARVLGSQGRFDEAIATAMEATVLAPRDAGAWEQLAALHADRGDVQRLLTVVDVQRRDFAERAATWYFAASAALLQGRVIEARSLAGRAVQIDAGHADAHNLLGAALAESGDVEAARQAFRASLRLDPRDAVTYTNLAELVLTNRQPAIAAELFQEALSLDPTSMPAREGLARARARR